MTVNQLKKRQERQQNYMDKALLELASVSGNKSKHENLRSEDPLVAACLLVAQKMKIHLIVPKKEKLLNSKDPLLEIVRASQIRHRQVALKGEWWRTDSGPLLAFSEANNRPLALIPIAPDKYEIHDVSNGQCIPLTHEEAFNIKGMAYTFYRPFPSKALKPKDLLIFSGESVSKRDVFMVVLMGLLGGLIGMINPIATGIMMDRVIPQADRYQLFQIGALLLSFAVGKVLFDLTRSFAMMRIETRMDSGTQAAIWDRLISLPAPFFKDYSSGELAMRAMSINQIRKTLSATTLNTIISGIFSIFNGFLMFRYSSKLAWTGLGLIVIAIAFTIGLGFFQIRYERQWVEVTNKISGLVLQIIGGVSKFRVSGSETRAFYKWATAFAEQRKIAFKKETLQNFSTTFNTVFPVITSMVLFSIIGANSALQTMSIGSYIAFYSAFSIFLSAMLQFTDIFLTLNTIKPIFESARPILETLPEYDEDKADCGELDGSIEIGQVFFKYIDDGPLILNDISLKVKPGEYIALVGPSGCGKSTLLRILLGFEKPKTGKVYYSGQDLDSIDIRGMRKQLGVVLQNGQLMSGDIYTNIVGSNANLTMQDAEAAAKMSGLYEDIQKMPMGLHTVVSEGGGTLSGGQKQRLMIARAIVNKPKILYFDEATSALDNRTQKIVSESLDKLNATRIVIAHRLSTVMNCDRIIVLDKGKIVEEGNYEELMRLGGKFAELAKRQLA
ncbi:NHLP bacteriocin export ABC transporter permease/ATPase subunit [Fusibacter ferrireducens]|uniref:NHLP bacteriocin export ABC transporter permease/ATPase subunit n=1 Tax=Fusibacter ferrireducens TaxID=2785058 RepID=A0ABR9ZSK2_9FIRM|nr:NHLP bacteriocin export ABC transporter permease/ATPase subunit [Fusibacter ferrireducens]MBF4692599.1 NHLP bacteriocin export ABC transporter permease/ATPase subunit [Fusibacter ferrireducens]